MYRKEIEKMISSEDIESLITLLKNEENIDKLKSFDFLIDMRGNEKYKDIICKIEERVKDVKSLKYLKEIKIVNSVFNRISMLQNEIKEIPNEIALPIIIYSCAIYVEENLNLERLFKEEVNNIIYFDKILSFLNLTIKSLIYNEKIFKDGEFLYKNKLSNSKISKEIENSGFNYLLNSLNAAIWSEKYKLWKEGIYEIRENENIINLSIINKELLLKQQSPSLKRSIYEIQESTNHFAFLDFYNSFSRKKIDLMEFPFKCFLKNYFFADYENILINGVSVKFWFNVYAIIGKYSKKNYYKNNKKNYIVVNLTKLKKVGFLYFYEKGFLLERQK